MKDHDHDDGQEAGVFYGEVKRSRAGIVAAIASVLAALLAGGALTVTVTVDHGPKLPDGTKIVTPAAPTPAPAAPPATAVDGPDADGKFDDALPLDTAAQTQLERMTGRSPAAEIADPLRERGDSPATTTVPGPLAADEIPGCRTRFVRNSSTRGGVTPRIIVWHQTVSRENGESSQNALTALANRPSSGVSWAALIGRSRGLCTYTVPLALKAWTQSNANRFSVGIEVEAVGDEGEYVVGDGRKKLVSVTRYIGHRYGIPMRRGLVRDCRVIRSGIVEHSDLGPCGGGHVDVTLRGVDDVIREAAAGSTSTSTIAKTDRRRCSQIRDWRRAGRPKGGAWERRSVWRRHALERRHLTCSASGVRHA